MSRFSIVIPVYKTKEYLDHCVESIIAQTFGDFEIILVDDGSPDCCPQMCDAWAARDPRIRVVHQENGGLSVARNTGIRHASGDYVMFLDSDDWWADDEVLEQIARHLDRTDADVLSFNYRKSYDGKLEPPYFSKDLPTSDGVQNLAQMTAGGWWITGACNKAIRRSLLEEWGLYFREGTTAEDVDWTLRLALYAERYAFANVCVFIYRQHGASISHGMTPLKVERLCGNVCECVRQLENADEERAQLLKPFVAYQYGVLLFDTAILSSRQRSRELMEQVRQMRWLLDCGTDGKVRLIRTCCRMFGFSATLGLLRLRQTLLQWRGKGV